MASTCRLWLLGGFRAEVGGVAVAPEAWRHRRGADLVKLLALAQGHRAHREQVADALWPDLEPQAAGANLRKALHFARRALGGEEAVEARGPLLALWPAGSLWVDAEAFEDAASAAIRTGDPAAGAAAAELYGGDLLPEDLYEAWTGGPRDRLHRLFVRVLEVAGRWDRVVEVDPLDERAHRELIRASLEARDRQGAMRQFESLRAILAEQLGVGPDPESVRLYEEVLALEGPQPSTPQERAGAHLATGLVAMNRMDLDEAEREARAARTLAVEAGLGRELGQASGLLGMVAHARGAWRALFEQEFMETLSVAPHLASFVFDAHLCLGEFSLCGPEGPDAVAEFAGVLMGMAEDRGSDQGIAVASLMMGEADLLAGRMEGAERHLSRAADLHERAGTVSGHALSLERLAEAALGRGERTRAGRLLRSARALAEGSDLSSHLVVRVLGAEVQLAAEVERATGPGDRPGTGAAAEVKRAESELSDRRPCEPCSMPFLLAAATACARAGAALDAERFLGQADRVASMWQGGPWLAGVWEARAELRLAKSEPAQAVALFREAAELFGRSGHSLSETRCRGAAGRAGRVAAGNVPGTVPH